ncbi:MAG: TfoX/Sxy family protein [Hyphomicrobium sp.]
MSASEGFIELLKDSMRGLGPVSVRRMFGGAGIYADGVMFGLIADDTLYFKADEKTKRDFEAEGLAPFVYEGGGRKISMSYWRIPERLLDDPDEMVDWARTALGVAQRAAAAKPKQLKTGKLGDKAKKSKTDKNKKGKQGRRGN